MNCYPLWITSWNQDCWEKYQQPQVCRWYYSNGRKWRGTEETFDEGENSEKAYLKLNIQKTRFISSGPITSWQIDGGKVETVADIIFLGSRITPDCDHSHEMKRCSLFGRKAMTNLRKVTTKVVTVYEKQRHHFANKGPYSQSYGFSSSHVQMWELDHKEGWVPQRIDAFELWCWRRLFRVPWRARRSNKSILKEINLNIYWKD